MLTGALARASGESLGSYAINQGTLVANSNYTIAFTGNTLNITPAPLTVAANHQTKQYGSADPTLTYAASGFQFTDSAATVLTGALARASGESLGSYAINQGTLVANSNYTIAFSGNMLNITPAPLTVTANPQTKQYGSADPALTYAPSGFQFADSAATVLTGALARVSGESVGSYAINQGTLAANSNYTISFTGNTLTITARAHRGHGERPDKVYGAADPALTYQVTSGSLASGDSFTGALTRAAGQNVGTYAITQGTLSINNIGNYNLTYVGANLTITAAPITVTANAQSKVYGAADPALTYQVTSGSLASGDSFTGALTRAAGQNVGTYAITQGTLTINNIGNYTLTFVGANLTITAAPIAVTANAQSKVYGAADPALTYQVTSGSLASGDSFTGALTRAAGQNVGTYAITQGTLSINNIGNYTLTFVGANLTITAASLTITASSRDDDLRRDGARDHSQLQRLCERGHGGQPDDTAPTCTTTADQQQPVGSYPSSLRGSGGPATTRSAMWRGA